MVSSYLGLLRRRYRGRLDADADEFIDYAVDGAARMRTLIEGLLEYSRAGRGRGAAEPVELAVVTADVLRSLAAAMVEAGGGDRDRRPAGGDGRPRAARAGCCRTSSRTR